MIKVGDNELASQDLIATWAKLLQWGDKSSLSHKEPKNMFKGRSVFVYLLCDNSTVGWWRGKV